MNAVRSRPFSEHEHEVDGDERTRERERAARHVSVGGALREEAGQVAVAAERGAELAEGGEVRVEHTDGDDRRDDGDEDRTDARGRDLDEVEERHGALARTLAEHPDRDDLECEVGERRRRRSRCRWRAGWCGAGS